MRRWTHRHRPAGRGPGGRAAGGPPWPQGRPAVGDRCPVAGSGHRARRSALRWSRISNSPGGRAPTRTLVRLCACEGKHKVSAEAAGSSAAQSRAQPLLVDPPEVVLPAVDKGHRDLLAVAVEHLRERRLPPRVAFRPGRGEGAPAPGAAQVQPVQVRDLPVAPVADDGRLEQRCRLPLV